MSDFGSDRADTEALMNDLLPFAQKMLREYKEFRPFGGYVKAGGGIVWEGADNGNEKSPSMDLIDLLVREHQRMAQAGEITACATVYDIRTIPPARTEKQDAIAIALDHSSGYSVVVMFPYGFDEQGEVHLEESFAQEGRAEVFGKQVC